MPRSGATLLGLIIGRRVRRGPSNVANQRFFPFQWILAPFVFEFFPHAVQLLQRTLLIFKKGQVVEQIVGAVPKRHLAEKIEAILSLA